MQLKIIMDLQKYFLLIMTGSNNFNVHCLLQNNQPQIVTNDGLKN